MGLRYTLLILGFGCITIGHSQSLDLISVNPVAASNHVAVNSNISFTFNMNIASATINTDNFVIRGEQAGAIPGTFSGAGTSTVTFDPTNDFRSGEVIRVTITTGVATDGGPSLSSAFSFQFTVEAQASPDNPAFFGEQAPFTTSSDFVQDIGATDINGDGQIDVFGTYGENNLIWFQNAGNENFNQNLIPTTISYPRMPTAVDLDDDGDIDLVTGSSSEMSIAWYENDGNENFTENIVNTSAGTVVSVYPSDLDNDGDFDIIVASWNQSTAANGKLSWLENDGSESFTLHQISGLSTTTVYPIDVDGDGSIDIVAGTRNEGFFGGQENDRLIWFQNDGSGNFTLHNVSTERQFRDEVFAIDMDDDGDVDLLSAGALSFLGWYENDGNENFTEHELGPEVRQPTSIHASDIDGDGDIDILSTKELDDQVVWFENDGNQNFTERIITVCADLARGVYAADIDEDGDLDVLSASAFDAQMTWYRNTQFQSFDFVSSSPTPNSLNSPATSDIAIQFSQPVADFSLQGFGPTGLGPVIVRSENRGAISGTWSGGGTNTITFDPDEDLLAGDVIRVTITFKLMSIDGASLTNGDYSFQFVVGTTNGPESPPFFLEHVLLDENETSSIESVYAADFDTDSDTDLVTISNGTGSELAWYANDGLQSFTKNQLIEPTEGATSVIAANTFSNGNLDILSTFGGILNIQFNNESGGFNGSSFGYTDTEVGEGNPGAVSIDLNGDGQTNIISAIGYSDDNPVSELYYFIPEIEGYTIVDINTTLNQPNGVYASDLNSDGHNDVLSWSKEGGEIGIYTNNKIDQFGETKLSTSFTTSILQVFPSDLNNDGYVDLLANSNEALYWYQYDGNNYTEHLVDNTVLSVEKIYVADIDGDDDNDLIGVGESLLFEEQCVFVLENDGSGSFTIHEFASSSTDLSDTYVTDLDRDGDLDILASGRSGSKLMWFENTVEQTFEIAITSNPEDQSVCPGSEVSLQVAAQGAHNLSYQWQQDSGDGFVNLADGEFISGSTNTTLGLSGLTSDMDGYQFRCVISGNFANSVESDIASVGIIDPIAITTEPMDITAAQGDNITFTTTVAGDNIAYQWKKGDVDLSGETSNQLAIDNVTINDVGSYQLQVSNQCGSEESQVVLLNIPENSVATNVVERFAGLQFYPNPASDYIEITPVHDWTEVNLLYLNGSTALTQRLHGLKRIDISHLKSGVYLMELKGKDSHIEKIMIKK